MDDEKVRINLPKDPIVLGDAQDGKPIWVDPKDFILSPDQKLEQRDNMDKATLEEALDKARLAVAARVEVWLQKTLMELAPSGIVTMSALRKWVQSQDFSYIEDTTTPGETRFVLRRNEKVISEFVCRFKT